MPAVQVGDDALQRADKEEAVKQYAVSILFGQYDAGLYSLRRREAVACAVVKAPTPEEAPAAALDALRNAYSPASAWSAVSWTVTEIPPPRALLAVVEASQRLNRASQATHETPLGSDAYDVAVDEANAAMEAWRAALARLEAPDAP